MTGALETHSVRQNGKNSEWRLPVSEFFDRIRLIKLVVVLDISGVGP